MSSQRNVLARLQTATQRRYRRRDTDGDGYGDGDEVAHGDDPLGFGY